MAKTICRSGPAAEGAGGGERLRLDARFGARLGLACLAGILAGCSPGPVIDRIPTEFGGLPAGAPQRSAVQPSYPGINDAATRPNVPLTPAEQLKLEQDLSAARAQQQQLQDPGAVERAKAQAGQSAAARIQALEAARKKATAADTR